MFIRTDDPIRDYGNYCLDQEMKEEARDYITCDRCGCKIYRADDSYEGDDYYEIDDENLCEDCMEKWIEDRRVIA